VIVVRAIVTIRGAEPRQRGPQPVLLLARLPEGLRELLRVVGNEDVGETGGATVARAGTRRGWHRPQKTLFARRQAVEADPPGSSPLTPFPKVATRTTWNETSWARVN